MGNEDGGFGERARHYVSSVSHRADRSLALVPILLEPAADWKVLDIATGAGHTALALAPRVERVVATDLSEGMLVAARRLTGERRVDNLHFSRADVHALPFRGGAFDGVTCRIAAHHFTNLAVALREMVRALRHGGRLLVIDNCAAEDEGCARWMNAFERLRDPSHVELLSPTSWHGAFATAGLSVLSVETFQYRMSVELWFANVEAPPSLREKLLGMADAAPEVVGRHVCFHRDGDCLSSFGIDRMIALCEKPL